MPRNLKDAVELGVTPKVQTSPYLIRIDQVMELGLINSREFQTRREDLYLAALPVTRERFAFSAQAFAIEQIVREKTGAALPEGEGNRWRFATTAGISKLFSTGALLLVGFANQTVIELGSPVGRRTTSVSNIDLDFIQPLLRGGGRAVTLEPLTQVERNLLYEIRDYARFRKQYYQYMIGGGLLPGIGSTSAGNLSANHPLPGSLAAGNPARQQVAPSNAGTLNLGVPGAAVAEGFLPSIFKAAVYQNEDANVQRLQKLLPLFEAYARGGIVSYLQVDQVRLQLLQGETTKLARAQEMRDSLDNLKLQLGIPVDTPLELDDETIRPIVEQLARLEQINSDFRITLATLDTLDRPKKVENMREELLKILRDSPLSRPTRVFRVEAPRRWKLWHDLATTKDVLDRLSEHGKERRALNDLKGELEKKKLELSAKQEERLAFLEFESTLGNLEFALRRYEQAKDEELSASWRRLRQAFYPVLSDASIERFAQEAPKWHVPPSVIVNGIDLLATDLEESYEVAMRTALANRLDLMNTRAQAVDAWRQLRVFANNLLGTFTVAYHMDSSTPPGEAKPLAFQAARTRHQLGMNFELPLVRVTERNAYRASQIAYQRARRSLDQAEDEIVNQVRSEVRQLQVLAKNLKIQQDAVVLAYKQAESSFEYFSGPAAPGAASDGPVALTNQLLQAYQRLPQAQNSLLRTWIDYHIARQQLYLDLELMPIDARGVWLDELSNQSPGRPDHQHERGAGNDDTPGPVVPAARFGQPSPTPESLPVGRRDTPRRDLVER
jgi:outer membrane protein TolC